MLRHGSLFSGIGGFDLAAEWAGWENVFHCEWNTFGQRVLKHYWPNAESFNDITKSDFSKYEHTIDIISGGFPCHLTESPLCSGNNGLPQGLDGITVPSWRMEALKAYGNAIVPQVALQIFNAINEYEKLRT